MAWRLNHSSALPWHRVTSDGSLVLLHADQSAQGDYSCYDSQGVLLHAVRLRLGRECRPDWFTVSNWDLCERPPHPVSPSQTFSGNSAASFFVCVLSVVRIGLQRKRLLSAVTLTKPSASFQCLKQEVAL